MPGHWPGKPPPANRGGRALDVAAERWWRELFGNYVGDACRVNPDMQAKASVRCLGRGNVGVVEEGMEVTPGIEHADQLDAVE